MNTTPQGFQTNNSSPRPSIQERLRPYVWAVLAVIAAIALRDLLTRYIGFELPFVTLAPSVVFVAFIGGLGPTLLATALSVVAAFVLLIAPLGPVSLSDPVTLVSLGLFAITGVMAGCLGELRLREHRQTLQVMRRAELEAGRAEEEAIRAEEEATRAEEETLRAEEQTARAEEEAQIAARESARVERILSSITDAFVVVDSRWTITYMNQRAAALFGNEPHEYIGRNFWEAFPESLGTSFERGYRRAMSEGHPVRVEAYYPPIQKWLEVTTYPSSDGLTMVGQDVTPRVRAHEASTRLAAIVESAADAIVGKRLDGTITTWNAGAERIFGYTADETVGRSIFMLIPPELHQTERDVLHRVSRGEAVEMADVARIRKDGRRIYIALTVSPIRDAMGEVIGASSIKRDITSQKETAAALAAASARSQELAQALDAAQVVVRDLDGRIRYWSTGATRLYGWTSAEAVGRVIHELLQTEFMTPLSEIQATVVAGGQWEGELVHTAKDGRRVYVTSQWVIRQDGNEPIITEVNTDITARRQVEERLRQSERMEVVGQLAGGVAHETNNQMTVVLGATEFLLARTDLAEIARRDLEQIRGAAERTAAITAQLLAFSRRQVLQPQVLSLDEVVQGLEGMLRRALGERSTLDLRLHSDEGRVKADPGQLAQVALNLVLNARDAMPLGGRLTIETAMRELAEDYADRHAGVEIRAGPYVMLAVSDTGHGMSSETMRHIFEPFYTTKPTGKGTGLGLATVYGIIKQSGGYVWAYSEPGHGTTFKVYLPRETGSVARPQVSAPPEKSAGENVLLVEDEPSVRLMASRALQEYGYRVLEASDGPEALRLVEQANGDLDLIITDVIIPGLDGRELARRAASVKPDLPILFMSGYTDEDIVRRGLVDPSQPFLQKPFTPDTLVRRVGELLGRTSRP